MSYVRELVKYFLIVFFTFVILGCGWFDDPDEKKVDDLPEVIFEASGELGTSGGRIEVSDENSPLKGAFIEIPVGVLNYSGNLSIEMSPPDLIAPDDSNAIIVDLQPSGLRFSEPIEVGLPYAPGSNVNNLRAFYFDPDSGSIVQVPIISVDETNHIAIAEITHFSPYYSSEDGVWANIEMTRSGNRINGTFSIYGNSRDNNIGLQGIPVNDWGFLSSGLSSAKRIVLDDGRNSDVAVFRVRLYQNLWGSDRSIAEKKFYVHRIKPSFTYHVWVNADVDDLENNIISTDDFVSENAILNWFDGSNFVFSAEIPQGEEHEDYYISIAWQLRNPNDVINYTSAYYVDNKDDSRQFSTMTESANPDINQDGILDTKQNYVPDDQVPTITSMYPSQNVVVSSSVTLSATAEDNIGIDRIAFEIESDGQYQSVGEDHHPNSNNQSYTVQWNSRLVEDGAHNYRVTVYDASGNMTQSSHSITVSNSAQNQSPYIPRNPIPPDNSGNTPYVNTTLQWTCSDPDGDNLTYNIYFGTSVSPPLVFSGSGARYYDLNELNPLSTYYWKIVASDPYGETAQSSIWSFSTSEPGNMPPEIPNNPFPSNGSNNIPTSIRLNWNTWDAEDLETLTHTIYFGTSSNPPIYMEDKESSHLNLSGLNFETTYYWKIKTDDGQGNSSTAPIWHFTTTEGNSPPDLPRNPYPANAQQGVNRPVTLSWECSDENNDQLVYDVYLSSQPTLSSNTNYRLNLEQASVTVGNLTDNITIYWKVVAKDINGGETEGPVWSFFIPPAGNLPPNIGDVSISPSAGPIGSTFRLEAVVHDPNGDSEISEVRFNVNSNPEIGGVLLDNGTAGDYFSGDGIYTYVGTIEEEYYLGFSILFSIQAHDAESASLVKGLRFTVQNGPANTPPTANFIVDPFSGTTATTFSFDAAGCTDSEDDASQLQVRWDWENDGTWDTGYSTTKTAIHQFLEPDEYSVLMEVKDTGGLSDSFSETVTVRVPSSTGGLIAHYPFNGNTNDESGNGNDGIRHGASLSVDRFGTANSAYTFDGIDDYIEFPNNSGNLVFNDETPFSILLFANLSSIQNSFLISSLSASDGDFRVNMRDYDDGRLEYYISKHGSSNDILSVGSLVASSWHHLALISDGENITGYLDGLSIGSSSIDEAYESNQNASGLIAGMFLDNDFYFAGTLDDIYIYDKTLTSSEVLSLYHEGNWPSSEGIVTDVDGNIYQTVIIGNQEWMAENLKVTHYRDGTAITNVTDDDAVWQTLRTAAYCIYNNNASNEVDTYGALYNWYAVENSHHLAPEGWHVPSDEEWKELEMALGMSQSEADNSSFRGTNEGSKLAGNAELWIDGVLDNDSAFGVSGFNALPGGARPYGNGGYYVMGRYSYFWSFTELNTIRVWNRQLCSANSDINRWSSFKYYGYAVRLVKD